MGTPILATKTFVPATRRNLVLRPRLVRRMDEALQHKLTLVSAPAGFGKTTVVAEWVAGCGRPVAWLSLDEGDNDPIRFLTYFVAALQTIEAQIGRRGMEVLQSPQPPTIEWALTDLLNELTAIAGDFVIVLDDYHWIEATAVDEAVTFVLEHQPAQMHVVIATREDPHLPLAQLRSQSQLVELRINELRFAPSEAGEFLRQAMGLSLSTEEVEALEARTEGWIAGLQLAALSMQGDADAAGFIKSFTGSHRFILDYLVEEVLGRQPEEIQAFLLRTSILERLCAQLCEAVLPDARAPAQETLEYLERANLFTVPLDNERHWYRYHHLFADLLRQRLQQSGIEAAELHRRASAWCEENGFEIEAFQHAAASNDLERCERLIDDKDLDLQFRGVTSIRDWLESLPRAVLDARPSLWVRYASALLVRGQTAGVEDKLLAAEAALAAARQPGEGKDQTRNLIEQIAAVRATLARTQHKEETSLVQSHRKLEPPDDLLSLSRLRAKWTMAMADHFQGESAQGSGSGAGASSGDQAPGNVIYTSLKAIGLGQTQESENRLHEAAETYRRVLELIGDHSPPNAAEAQLGLARIHLAWNDLEAAERHVQASLQLVRQYDQVLDKFVTGEVLLARVKLAQGDAAGAAALLEQARRSAVQNNFVHRILEVVGVEILVLLHEGDLATAAQLAQTQQLPFSKAQVLIAQGDPSAALAILEPLVPQVEARNWQDERLRLMILRAAAFQVQGDTERAVQVLTEALTLAEPGGFIRLFMDQGAPMAQALSETARRGIKPEFVGKLLAAFRAEAQQREGKPGVPTAPGLIEPLSERELDVLRLIAQGLSNTEISRRLFLALSTVKGHNRVIFNKLQVQRRTEAAARARALGLI